ncbi:carboxymuconolactone decarboxylase family protein [Aquibium sp. ELW1220]|uniref:carboxymuconolactone decarboxylase family protein n=1 Tax=Aquibium sp. ELW1220 TaxID=2976766 RepID=UPI0025B0CF4D|nr:carboxymuconolactone decarboxylase family protein [Aquibium sp. ELW1220]MDN2582306.1 carboxymuconolactone decarboxylase family protein [Aquibium sp. ELW1220]
MTTTPDDLGIELRRKMFGSAGAEKQIDNASDFTAPMQDIVTRICFGEIWQRPGLATRERSMITLAMLAALGKEPELKVHVRGAIANGVTKEEIREILIHSFLYCGIPAMVGSLRAAETVLTEIGA